MKLARSGRPLLIALALIGSCGKDKTTALDVRLEVTGALDQIRIDTVMLGNDALDLTGEQTLFPATPQMLKTGDVLTIWLGDSADMKGATVTATGRLCGKDATAQKTTPSAVIAKGQTVQVTLALANNGTACTGTDGGAGAGGTGGVSGTAGTGGGAGSVGGGGAAGSVGGAGGGGTTGTGGAGGAAGTGSAGRGGTTGTAGTVGTAGTGGGAAGRGGTTGSAGTGGGAAGRGGTTGTAGTGGGVAGRGGTTGTAGTGGGVAGRGGTTGSAGTGGGVAGRGGTTGTAGTGGAPTCGTTPAGVFAQQLGTNFPSPTTCGYPVGAGNVIQYIWTPPGGGMDLFALGNSLTFNNGANCGRCVELVRSAGSSNPRRVTVTLVGSCTDQACQDAALPRFALSPAAWAMLATSEPQIPPSGDTLTYSFVGCPVPIATDGQPERIRANLLQQNGTITGVLFVGQRYGIYVATTTIGGGSVVLSRGNDNYWRPPNGMVLGAGSVEFILTDTNSRGASFIIPLQNFPMFGQTSGQFPTCP
jgi:hypothetical protein